MCRCIVKATAPRDPVRNYHAGDLIGVEPDGHEWTAGELADPTFAFVDIPGVDVEAVRHLLAEDRKQGRGAPLLRRRDRSVDLDKLGHQLRARGARQTAVTIDLDALMKAVRIKAPAEQPDVF